MAGAFQKEFVPLSVAAFRDWAASRPDEERWELIDGVPMMMAPATRDHQRIASNLERLLNDALEHTAAGGVPRLAAYQRIGLNLGAAVQQHDPEPDVAVVEVAAGRDPRYADSFLLAAEVVSASDLKTMQGKAEIYKLHRDCVCVLVIYQDHCEVSVELRKATRWTQQTLLRLRDRLVLTCGRRPLQGDGRGARTFAVKRRAQLTRRRAYAAFRCRKADARRACPGRNLKSTTITASPSGRSIFCGSVNAASNTFAISARASAIDQDFIACSIVQRRHIVASA